MDICIHTPIKTETVYSFDVTVTPSGGEPKTRKIGITAQNFALPHLDLWDSFLPLMWATRNGGPLFGKDETHAAIRADFPLHADVVAFFEQRARDFGLDIDIVSGTFHRTYDIQTSGTSVLFGGGKDSRLLLGTLRELGEEPSVVSAGGAVFAKDIKGALCFDPFDYSMPNRIVPALMLAPKHLYHGSGLGEVHQITPWQQYFDISAASAVRQTSNLLKRLGLDITIHVPQSILPYNVTQNILARRYPELFAGQVSVRPQEVSDKNLHVTLLKRYHGLPYQDHCSDELLSDMVRTFVERSLRSPKDFGHRAHREVIDREKRAILFRLSVKGELVVDGARPLQEWDEPWIDHIHLYCHPDAEPRLVHIYRAYAKLWENGAAALPEPLQSYLPQPRGESVRSKFMSTWLGQRISRVL